MTIAGTGTAGRPIDDTAAPITATPGEVFGNRSSPGQLTISGTGTVYLGGTLTNAGTIPWAAGSTGTFYFDGGTLANQAGGAVDLQANRPIALFAGAPK